MAMRGLVRGVGDIGSAVAHRLVLAGHAVAVHDGEQPTITRRGMAFADAVFDGRTTLDGVATIRVDDPDAVPRRHRMRFAVAHACALTACLLLVGLLMPPSCWAYRPFISTDAAVADPQEVEVELGSFTLERDKGENSFIIPRVVLNYGLFRNWEAVGEFAVLRSPDGDVNLIDPALFVKAVQHRGGGRAPSAVDGKGRATLPFRRDRHRVGQARSSHASRERRARRATVDRRGGRHLGGDR